MMNKRVKNEQMCQSFHSFPEGRINMTSIWRISSFALLSMAFLTNLGCTPPSAKTPANAPSEEEHAHASHGPHDGTIIELGDENYHAELVHDEATGKITVYVLDSAAKSAVPIEASNILVNVQQGEQGRQFKLMAEPDAGDSVGKSSRFSSTEAELGAALDAEDAKAALVLEIAGVQYRGEIAHDHDEDHEYEHNDEHGH
jgi:hypothetical protein